MLPWPITIRIAADSRLDKVLPPILLDGHKRGFE